MSTTTVNLRADAAAEARRLTMIRAITGRREHVWHTTGATGPLIARARTARRRRALRGQMLLVWQVGCEDASGRITSTALVPLLVRLDVTARTGPPSWLRAFVDRIDSRIPGAIDSMLRIRQQGLAEACAAHARARLARERAIAAHASQSTRRNAFYQAGLFDRRSDRAHLVRETRNQEAEDEAQGRVLAAASAATVSHSRPRLLLVLLP
ncbi:MAG TPA: hypothetical protein VKE96_17560 [Vicinamibacterales bacterium]|nr:hypothetical protein [Vicinamibacterales bacterium]